ncbi:MAG: hypothetical protein IT306_14190 [Chloroflexi bacterium]|nr:hypothetical protein [Chloroflexota bacterium]
MSRSVTADAAILARAGGIRAPHAAERRARLAPVLVVLAVVVAAVLPAWNPVWYQDDQLPTLFRTFHTDLAHHYGVLYPRLAPELGFGYGRLLHQFYPPFGVELAAWLHTLGLGFVTAARLTFSLCLLSSALGMYVYAQAVLPGRWPAALAASGFVWAPYVLLDAHKGGVLGESIAMAVMPWSLLAVDRLARRGSWTAFGAASGGLALVVLGHNITALFFVGLGSLYAALLAARIWLSRGRRGLHAGLTSLARSAAAVLLAMALAAIYWLPALAELTYSRVSDQRTGEFTVTRWLVGLGELLQPAVVFDYYVEAVPRHGLAAASLIGAAAILFVVALARARSRPRRHAGEARTPSAPLSGPERRAVGPDALVLSAFILTFVVVLALQLKPSAIVWETAPLISFVQFPQRLFVFSSFAGALVLGSLPWAVQQLAGHSRLSVGAGVGAGLLLGLTSLPGIYWTWPVSDSHVIDEADMGIGTAAERRLSERKAFDDYFPSWVEEDAGQITRPPTANRARLYAEASSGPVPRLTVLERGYLGMTLRTESDGPAMLILHQFYFPGWQATADGQALEVGPVGPLGLVRVTVPAGQRQVRVGLGETPSRLAATALSVGALVLLLAIFVRGAGLRHTAITVAVLALAILIPRLLHNHLDPEMRPPVRPVQAQVTPEARVVGLELDDSLPIQGELEPVTVLWQAVQSTPRDLQTGVRLLTPDGSRVISERWGRPNRERTPTGKWMVGEIVADTHLLRVPAGTPPGRYRLQAGLRDPDARDRSPLGLTEIGELEVR